MTLKYNENMIRTHKLIISFALIFLLSACSSNKEMVKEVSKAPSYEDVLNQYTREGKLYDNFDTQLIAYATYKDNAFMKAQIDKQAKDMLYDSSKVDILKLQSERDNETHVNFFVALYTPDDRFADFSKEKGLWKFYIKRGDSNPIEADKIKKVSRADKPIFEALYRYLSPWMQGYKVSFKKLDGDNSTAPLTLIITGQLGKMELTYN